LGESKLFLKKMKKNEIKKEDDREYTITSVRNTNNSLTRIIDKLNQIEESAIKSSNKLKQQNTKIEIASKKVILFFII
jgi:hypothetical protein